MIFIHFSKFNRSNILNSTPTHIELPACLYNCEEAVLGGRINGAEISRVEKEHSGSVPAQTLREEIDYSQVPALLKRGYVGVKVWIHKKQEE